MKIRRLQVILSNITQELLDKVFDCDKERFNEYLELEIGLTKDEIEELYRYMDGEGYADE